MYDKTVAEMYRNCHRDAARQRERMLAARTNIHTNYVKIFVVSAITGAVLDTYTLDTTKPQNAQICGVLNDLERRGADISTLIIQHEI